MFWIPQSSHWAPVLYNEPIIWKSIGSLQTQRLNFTENCILLLIMLE